MDRKEIVDMKVGRKLDSLIAEKIFGWYWEYIGDREILIPPFGSDLIHLTTVWDKNGLPLYLPHYSTNIDYAWEIIDKLKGSEYVFEMNRFFDDIFIFHFEKNGNFVHVESSDLAEGISMAGLLAVLELWHE